jgi:ABC-type dipeptide/oligopeptide/nickel transport system permease subunit
MPKMKKQNVLIFILVSLIATMALTACGGAVIDVNVDPNTGQGNIVVNDHPSNDEGVDVDITTDDNNQDMSQILLFGIVVALLLGTVAIVVSTSRRERA